MIRSDQFSGHILYVTVWTSNCSSCQAQLVALDKLSRQYENEAVGILSISVDASFEDWKKSLAGRPWTSQHAYVEGGLSSEFCKSYLIEGTPRNIMIGKNGEIIDVHAFRPNDQRLKLQIDSLLHTGYEHTVSLF